MLGDMADLHLLTTRQLLDAGGGVVTARQLREAGVGVAQVASMVAKGLLHRLRRDVLVDAGLWEGAPPWDRHALRAVGVVRSLDPAGAGEVALSHHSSLAVRRVCLHGVDDDAHLVRLTPGRPYRSTALQVHSRVDAQLVSTVDGLAALDPAPSVLQVAALFGPVAGLVAADSALHQGLCTPGDLRALTSWTAVRQGRRHVEVVVALADGRRESAGESRTAWALHLLGHGDAVPQAVIRTPLGEFVARVDFLLGRVVIEFDGMGKYTGSAVLKSEKLREDALRALGYEVVRLTWDDLDDLAVVRAKIGAALARCA